MIQKYKYFLIGGLLVVALLGFGLWQWTGGDPAISHVGFSAFRSDLENDRITDIVVRGRDYTYTRTTPSGDETVQTRGVEPDRAFNQELMARGISIRYQDAKSGGVLYGVLVFWLPMIVLLFVVFYFMRPAGSNKMMSFGKSAARQISHNTPKVTFKNVAGIDEARDELEELIDFLKDSGKFKRLGGRIPKGVLLMGPPGTGKTLLARAIAGEAGVSFFSISGSDFVEMFVGVGASRVRDLFEQGKKASPCIIFIDEIDAVGRQRGAGVGGGHDEREQTLNQLLVEMDGFESNDGVIIVAATNRPDVLDPALLRPGRFDRIVAIMRPDVRGREGILAIHTRRTPIAPDVSLSLIARGTPGFAGADLENLVNEAALLAARQNKDTVDKRDFETAKDKILMGVERRSMILGDAERRTTAFHEAGHALSARLISGTDPVHKVTIIPRGRSLGLTQQLPEADRLVVTESFTKARIAVLMGGRIAEEVATADLSNGANQDIQTATSLARKMVCEWGMSRKLGPVHYGRKEGAIFLGREIAQPQGFSERTASLIDDEVQQIVMMAYKRSRDLIESNLAALTGLAERLLEVETLNGDEVDSILIAHGARGEVSLVQEPPP